MVLKTPEQMALMRRAGILLWRTHQLARDMAVSGVRTKEMDAELERFILENGAEPLFKGQPGEVPYPATACISVNEEIVHGIPGERMLRDGDIVSVDIGLRLDGWCADCACTHAVGEVGPEKRRLMDTTEDCLRLAIREMRPGRKWSAIARKMLLHVRKAGFSVVEELVGHGIGREMWEAPQVPNYPTHELNDFLLRPGLVLAVEPMVNAGARAIRLLPDHWTIVTADGRPSAHFEHVIAITPEGPEVLTRGPEGEGWAM